MSASLNHKEGWLHKRGEHIKTWRPRYFVLKTNGYFLGYNSKPTDNEEINLPNNIFQIKDCKLVISNKPKQNAFIIKILNSDNSYVERYFATSTLEER